mmetsp:Transcript_31629/g.95605  ORF Transcript_31629/g.95605 Transcript_31629/m.95605 type:complete len:200 (-) Transcript_31629:133-732(-)
MPAAAGSRSVPLASSSRVAKTTLPPRSIDTAMPNMPKMSRLRRPTRSTRTKEPMELPITKATDGRRAEVKPWMPRASKSVPPKETMALMPVMIWKNWKRHPNSTTLRKYGLSNTSLHVALPTRRSSSSSARTKANSRAAEPISPPRKVANTFNACSERPTLSKNRGVSPTNRRPPAVARPRMTCTPNDQRHPEPRSWSR